jgi:hypothetical protein
MPIKADLNINNDSNTSSNNNISRNSSSITINNSNNQLNASSNGKSSKSSSNVNDKLTKFDGGEQQIIVSISFKYMYKSFLKKVKL